MRMLLVEDNRQLAEMLTKGLQAAGYDADHLATSAEARSVLTTTRYAALILDLGLPDGDGLSILRELRDRKDPLPILVLTARASLHDRVSGLRSGADDYLVKPFDFDELVARLEALLRRPGRLLEKLTSGRQSHVRHRKPPSLHRRHTTSPVRPRSDGAGTPDEA